MLLTVLLAISLSIDALGIGATYGLQNISIPFSTKLILTGESMLLMALFLFVGNRLTLVLPPIFVNRLGVLLIMLMGFWLCLQSFLKKKKEPDFLGDIALQFIRTPSSCDRDSSAKLDAVEAVTLGFILSLDSLATGIGAGAAGISILTFPPCAAIFQTLFLTLGVWCGKKLTMHLDVKESIWTAISGGLLLIIGLLRLFF